MFVIILRLYFSNMVESKRFFKVLSVAIAGVLLVSCSEERESYTVTSNKIVESVYSSVVIEPAHMYKVNATIPGDIDEIFVKAGDSIKAGEVILTIRDVQSRSSADNAKLAYELAKRNYRGDLNMLNDLKLELNNAAIKRQNDSLNYYRNKQLYERNAVTKVDLENSELMFTSSKNNHELIRNKIDRMAVDLKTSMEQAKNTYTSSLSRSNDAVVTNRLDGLVYDIYKEPGELVMTQETVAVVGSADEFVIKMLIDEVDITRVKVGQKIYVTLEAYDGQVFEARVTHITPKMDERTQTFSVDGVFVESPPKLYLGLTGEGNIVVDESAKSVVIPREYLKGTNKVETDAGEVVVKTGIKSLSHVQILSGLKEGDKIYKPE